MTLLIKVRYTLEMSYQANKTLRTRDYTWHLRRKRRNGNLSNMPIVNIHSIAGSE